MPYFNLKTKVLVINLAMYFMAENSCPTQDYGYEVLAGIWKEIIQSWMYKQNLPTHFLV